MSIRPVTTIVHIAALGILIYGYNKMINMGTPTDKWIKGQKGQYWQFLTVQALLIAILTMALSVLADTLPKNRSIIRAKRLMTMMSLPLAIVVSTIYWSLVLLAPSLILPRSVDSPKDSSAPPKLAYISRDVDLIIHLFPALFLSIDFYLLEEKYVGMDVTSYAPLMSIVFAVWYSSWIEYLAVLNRRFPYPFLEHPFPIRVAIYAAAATFGYMSFRLLNWWHSGKPILGDVQKKS